VLAESPVEKMKEKPTLTDMLRVKAVVVIDPIVTFLARYRLSPDTLTVFGMLSHFLLAYLIAIGQMTWAGIAMAVLAPLDALDGALARKLGRKQGGFGAFLDSTLDRLAEIVLFGGFIYYYLQMGDLLMLGLSYMAVTGSLMVSYVRSKAESLHMSAKGGVLSRVERYVLMLVLLILNQPNLAVIVLAIFTYVTVGQRMYRVWWQYYHADKDEAAEIKGD
jgi:CDP-diacylglycerol---glycerol-3-phosphate 3-phosphatidyltransferase